MTAAKIAMLGWCYTTRWHHSTAAPNVAEFEDKAYSSMDVVTLCWWHRMRRSPATILFTKFGVDLFIQCVQERLDLCKKVLKKYSHTALLKFVFCIEIRGLST